MTRGKGADVDQLMTLSRPDLDELFRMSPAGEIPVGDARGTVLAARGAAVSTMAARVVRLIVWKGKVFDAERGELRNRVTPFGVRAIRAKVYRDPSRLDDGECTVLDYSRTSVLAHWIRDEIREIKPGVYLGIVYWGRRKVLNFALSCPGSPTSGSARHAS
ncbi:hypothetical protein ACFWIB_37890 [Streptomyces sp. NPDC127051]|uniref:hypothetical protein n=1 Tax=Streptomyces sp. NPDC127051 TaxID=3347119 RepID=UPI003654DFD1